MKGQITFETVLIYGITLIATVIIMSSILYINGQVISAIERSYMLKEKALVIDTINELCELGNGIRYKLKLKYDHNIDPSSVSCEVIGEIRKGEVIFSNIMGKVFILT